MSFFNFLFLSFQLEYKNYLNTHWLKIFHHYSGNGKKFLDKIEPLLCNTIDKFSILSLINESYKINNSYEFLLEYPELNGYNRWLQGEFPLKLPDIDYNSYIPINISWNGQYWKGLIKSARSETLIEGSVNHIHWWYSIGTTYLNSDNTFPGPATNIMNFQVKEVILWIRINNNFNSKNIKKYNLYLFKILIFIISNE